MKSEETQITTSTNKKKICKWTSDKNEEQYCREVWQKTIEAAELEEDNYIDQIFQMINDVDVFSDQNKRLWKLSEYTVVILATLISFLNTLAVSLPKEASVSINIIAAVIAAALAILNGVKSLDSYKDTWLRQSKFRYELVIECHKFSTDSGEYKTIIDEKSDPNQIARKKIEMFKENTTEIIRNDYDRFFANMSKN